MYDHMFIAELKWRNPQHPFLNHVEAEPAFAGKTITLPQRMLSTEKAYDLNAMKRWLKRVEKAASACGVTTLTIRITPKLDGYAAYDDGNRLYTRGDGYQGTNISHVLKRGLLIGGDGKRGQGAVKLLSTKTIFSKN